MKFPREKIAAAWITAHKTGLAYGFVDELEAIWEEAQNEPYIFKREIAKGDNTTKEILIYEPIGQKYFYESLNTRTTQRREGKEDGLG